MISQTELLAGLVVALAVGLSGCGKSTAAGFPLNGVNGVSAEGTRTVTKTISWTGQEAKFEHTKTAEWKFYTTDYSCVIQPKGCSFSSRTEEKDDGGTEGKEDDIQSILLQSLGGGALTGTRTTLTSNQSTCKPFQGPDSLSPALPKYNGTASCPSSGDATCDVWRQYTAYKPKSDGQPWSRYKTEVVYYFKQGGNVPAAQVETQTVSTSNKTTTIASTVLFSKWELGEVGNDKFTADKDWNCDDKTALGAKVFSV